MKVNMFGLAALAAVAAGVTFLVMSSRESELQNKIRGTERGLMEIGDTVRALEDNGARLSALQGQTPSAEALRAHVRDLVIHWDVTTACAAKRGWAQSVVGEGGPCPTWANETEALQARNLDGTLRMVGLRCAANDLELAGLIKARRPDAPNDAAQLARISSNFEHCRVASY